MNTCNIEIRDKNFKIRKNLKVVTEVRENQLDQKLMKQVKDFEHRGD
jgi:hypothetical protein